MGSESSGKRQNGRSKTVRAKRLPMSSAVVFHSLFESKQEADEIVEQAMSRAREILAQAESERQDSVRLGYEQGLRQGHARGVEQYARAVKQVAEIREAASEKLIELAVRIASKVVQEAVEANPELVVTVARNALAHVRWCRQLILRVSPKDLEIVRQNRGELVAVVDACNELRLEGDPQIGRGGCVVESEAGTVDATLEAQLEALERGLLEQSRVGPVSGDPT